MSFSKLHDIALLEIFDQMDLAQLINAADLGPRYRDLITQYSAKKFRFHEKTIKISLSSMKGQNDIDVSSENKISMKSVAAILKTLRNFGHLISKLEIDVLSMKPLEQHLIDKYINEYCRRALIEISCKYFNENTMDEWKKPFENVEKVTLDFGSMNEPTGNRLNETFPKMRYLKHRMFKTIVKSHTEQHYPFLVFFEVFYRESVDLKQFSTLNRQLRTLHIWYSVEMEFLLFLNQTLPELDDLQFTLDGTNHLRDDVHDSILLSNVKKLAIECKSSDYHEIEHFTGIFPNIEEFKLFFYEIQVPSQWIEVITQMNTLKKLTIATGRLNTQEFCRIMSELTNLVELTVEFDERVSNSVIESMEQHGSLQKVTFVEMNEGNRKFARETISQDWKMRLDEQMEETIFLRNNNLEEKFELQV